MLGDRYSQLHLQEKSGDVRDRGLSAVQLFIPSAVEPGCRIPIHRPRWEQLLYSGVHRRYCCPNMQKILKNFTQFLQVALSMVQKWCDRTKLSINSQKTVVTQFTRNRCLRGLGHQSSMDIHCCWLPWNYSGQRIYMEGTAENVRNMAYRASLNLHGQIW